jgi:anti-sigma factor RsiW
LLDAFLDGELPADQTLAIEEHLAACEECPERTRFGWALRTSVRRAAYADAEPSAGFESRLASALRAERERALEPVPSVPPVRKRRWTEFAPLALAAAATFTLATLLNGHLGVRPMNEMREDAHHGSQTASMAMDPEQLLDELVSYHTSPPAPQITEPALVDKLEPEVGLPVHAPSLKQFGASWVGGGVIPVKNHPAAILRYRVSNHPVTVYFYDTRRVRLRGALEPRVFHNEPVHVGQRQGFSIAAVERRGMGCAVASDFNDDESAELVTTIY